MHDQTPVSSHFDGVEVPGTSDMVDEHPDGGQKEEYLSAFGAPSGKPNYSGVLYGPRRIAPLDYESETPRPPVFYTEALTAPHNVQKNSRPDPAIADVQKPPHTTSMPYSHMGVYRGPDMLGSWSDGEISPATSSGTPSADEETRRPGLLMHAPTAPPPYPQPTDMFSWIEAQGTMRSPSPPGPLSAPLDPVPVGDYPSSLISMDRPYNWIEDVTADQAIEAHGFKRCGGCSISYRVTDGKRCRCTPSEGDGERPSNRLGYFTAPR
ncbi:hypothetical protein GLOTRDRAFT_140439 [Gloeophyllum trabeum ATCC 11539]|uniref:Uncharacterized protein n=1 Tax=Gloeophyllum trabeum (strain ATCC 11539 / FP-39264 / Madison 617) TaxID=670483 RepID=S7PZC5_GLOTA|nr:uncharacterized protein GLOTRDRAFT_140439 [Gloeophyllum trabeum ATCC 11539]EPQ52833.1 hypothetical protein GLOTRDRAFT_140439 [Gloeophyllum trabeum ATCC 11539]